MLDEHTTKRRGQARTSKKKKGGKGINNRLFSAKVLFKCPIDITMIIMIYLFKVGTK